MRVSIITVVFNDKQGVRTTLSSIKTQTYRQMEVIVVDGQSTDGTVEVVRQFGETVSCFISEPDNGIYDAMNKGVKLATGDFVIFLNAGDYFFSDNVLDQLFGSSPDPNCLYFGRVLINSNYESWYFPTFSVNMKNVSRWLRGNVPNHQAMFFPKRFYQLNVFDTSLKISADADYKLRAQKVCNIPFVFFDQIVSVFEVGGVSTTYTDFSSVLVRARDSWKVNMRYYGFFHAIKMLFYLSIKFLIDYILGERFLLRAIKKIKGK
jgi:putative colanic acid biosynthesis glycosyltransferase